MPQLTNYYFDLFHRDVEPIIPSSSQWGVQGEYVIDSEHIGYTNWVSDGGELQTAIPNGEDVVMHINTASSVLLDMDVVAYAVEVGEEATLNVTDNHSLQISDCFTLNGLMSVSNNRSLTNAGEAALQLNGVGRLNLSGDGTAGNLGTVENRGAFAIGENVTVTTLGFSTGYIFANLTNEGTITTEAGNLTLHGNTVENTGAIVTGGKAITLQNATVNSTGALNGANGTLELIGATVNNGTLTGKLLAHGETSTLNQVTVDENGDLNIQGNVIAQGTLSIDGIVTVQNNKWLCNESAEETISLSGTGTLNLSGDGTSGKLGTAENRGAFVIGEGLTVTTLGYSVGYIFANLTNEGTIATAAGELMLNGNTIQNNGVLVTGGKTMFLQNATVNGIGTLNGENGKLQLNGTIVNNGTLTGKLEAYGDTSTLNQVTVDENGDLDIQGNVIAQGTLSINGIVTVQNNKWLYNESDEAAVALNGNGTLSLNGDGTSGKLGTAENRGAFVIGEGLTVTTLGYSVGYIFANLTNEGTIATAAGELTLNGNTIQNNGVLVTGGRTMFLQNATVNGVGTLNGANGKLQLNGATVNNGTLTGKLEAYGETSTLNQVTVDENGVLDIQGNAIAQGTLSIDGTVTVQNNKWLCNASAEEAVALDGTGTLSLSGDGTSGFLGSAENRGAFTIDEDLTVTTLGYSVGYIYANLTNAGTITTEAGELTLSGNTIENTGTIVTGGNKSITLTGATVNGNGSLNGRKGIVYLNNSTLTGAILNGQVETMSNKSTLKNVTVDVGGKFTATADVVLQESFTIDGTVSVQNNVHLVNEVDTPVMLAGFGTLSLSGNGTSGYLGSPINSGAFTIGKELTVTTLGYSLGYIYSHLTNEGTITTEAGDLTLNGSTIENTGSIVTGGKTITLQSATVNGLGTLGGLNGKLQLNGTTVNNGTLTGKLEAIGYTCTLNQVTVDEDGDLDIQANVVAQGTLSIDGKVTVENNQGLYNVSTEEAVSLTGTGTLNLSGDGTSGYLGTATNRGAFIVDNDLTVTTLGYSLACIYADITNQGEITTTNGDLNITGVGDTPLTFRNSGTIRSGSKTMTFTYVTMDNKGGSLIGGDNTVYLGAGTTVTGGTLGGALQVSNGASVLLDEHDCIRDGKITVTGNGTFTARNLMALADFNVEYNGSLELSNVTLAGTVNAYDNPSQVSILGNCGLFELVLNTAYAARYTILGNDFTDATVTIRGNGNIDLSGNYWGGLTDEDEIRARFGLGANVNVSNAMTTAPEGRAFFLIGADLSNEKYLSLAQDNLKLTFLSKLDPQSITEETVQLWDDTANQQVSLAERFPTVQGNQLIFDNDLLNDGHSYRVVLSEEIKSLDGSMLNTEFKGTVAFTVDRTAPKVLNIEKTLNLTGKLPDFQITFSSDVDISTLRNALKVTSPEGQNVNVEVAMLTDRVALVTSKVAINEPGEYTVSIAADKTADKAGNPLQESFEGVIEMTRINLDIKDLASSKTDVVQDETFTVQWKTFNQEDADLYGRWTDGVYLSKDNLWDNSDTLLASVVHYNGLPQGSSVSGQTQVALSGVTDGDYYLLVRPDIYNEKPTGASERNVESIAISVSTNPLPEGEQTINSGHSATYKFTAGAGDAYQLTLDTLRDDYSGMELYIGYGYSPTRENYDTAVRNANDAQLALASQNYDQDIYVMVYAKNGYGNYTLTAEKVGLDITAVMPGQQSISDGQALTFVVEGLCFTPGTTVSAINANEVATNGVVTFINDHQLLLTFETGLLEAGDYVLKATDGAVSVLSDTITLAAEGAPNLEITADLPLRVANHFITSFDVNYANTGNASMGAVLLTVDIYEVDNDGNKLRSVGIMGINKSTEQNHSAYNGSYNSLPTGYVSTATIYAQGKVPGQLEAGASGSVTIDLVGLLQPWNTSGNNNLLWEINYFDEYSTEVLDWRETMPGQSDAFYVAMENAVGTTWGDYVKMLQTNAQTLQSVGADASDATDLLALTVQSVSGNFNPYISFESISDLNVETRGTLLLSFERFYSNRMDDQGWHTNWEYSMVKEGNDAVTFFSPEQGVFTFRKDAYGKYFCENDSSLTLTFKGSQAILQSPDYERTWTMKQVDAQNWRLAQVSDTHGNSIQLAYDKNGELSKLTSNDGEFIRVAKDGLTASNGLEVTYQHSADGQLTGVSYNDGRNPLTYQYDGDALTGVYQGGEQVSSYIYDDSGSVVQATHGNLITTVTTEQPGVITFTDNCDHSFTAVYYADGNLAKLTDNVSGDWLHYTYDANGWLQTVSNSAGLSESYVCNAEGEIFRFTDIYGNTSSYTYFQGHLKTAQNATGYAVNISYDQNWNITEFTYSDGSVISFDYDENGNLTRFTDQLGNSMTCEYDDSWRISRVIYGDYSSAVTYDNFGYIATVTQNGHTTSYEYTPRGLLTSLTDANGNQAQMSYDGNENLTEAVFADGSKVSWGYDATGNLMSHTTRAGDMLAYQWNTDGSLNSAAFAGTQYEYTYNNAGLLTTAASNSVQNLAFGYNANGSLTGLTYQDGTAIAIDCDTTGKLASYTIGGQTFAYTWQGGKMSTISVNGNAFTAYMRNANGNLTSGNGIAYEYDVRSNITRVGDTDYTYNSVAQIVTKSTGEENWTYTYDLDGNLASEMLGDGTAYHCTYTYDAAGNRLSQTDVVANVTTTWTYGSMNQILTVQVGEAEAVDYTYDLNGNLLSDGHAAYTWTEDSRMATMTVDDTTWTFTYNALGYRDSASNGVDTYTFYYDGTGNLLAQYKNGEAYQFYIRGATGIEGYVDANGAIYTFTYDLGGNVTAVTGTNGKSATYVYDAFGNIIEQAGDITDNALTWHGHFGTLLNPDGSYHVLARNYNAADGRFISTDPSWFNDGANLYTYAYNDPINYLDLDGMKGDMTSLPTKHESGSVVDKIANGDIFNLKEIFSFLNDKTADDLTTNLPSNTPRIGTGDSPSGLFNTMSTAIDNGMPDACDAVGDYYNGGINVARSLYEKGTVSTKDGTIWPPALDTELNDRYINHSFERYQEATTQSGKEEFIQQAWRRFWSLVDKNKADKAKQKGGTNVTSSKTQSASSHDPNDKLATQGATELHFVQDGSRLQYTVLFENDPENATAPARKVYVRDVMDDNLDINTFQLHGFTLAGHAYQLPEGRDSFNGNVVLDLGDAEITVAVAINIDYETRELIASFTAIDPETGFELQDLTKGVLLVNDESGRGEGNVSYSIQALPDLPTDTQIHNTAEIFFDFNDPIETPTTLNTIDADAPCTASLTLSADDKGIITLAMSAEDVGAGVEGYNIRWSTDGEHFSDYGYTTYTQLQLPGRGGMTYYFQIQAVDAVGLTSEWSEIQSVAFSGIPTELEGDAMGLSWKPVAGAESYVVEYSTDAFEHFVRIQVIGTSLDSFSLPQASYQWRVRAAESDDWEYGEEIVAPEQVQTPQLVQSNEDGALDLFFAHKYDVWNGNYQARHTGVINGWNGTDETSPLDGKNMITDVFHGSTDRNLLYLTDDANGDALFIDDIYSELPGTLEEQQARIAQINEIRAGAGNDIIDLTSQRFEYVGYGMTVRGGFGDDVIWANNGNNWLFGDAGNDRIVGSSSDDVIVGGAGNDTMHGGGGDDIFAFGGNWGQDTVEQLAIGKVTLWFEDGDETKWNDQTLTYTDGTNSVKVSGVALENINLKFGDDNGKAIERNAELSAAGAFEEFTSEKIFEDKNRGMLA
ncbi:MAG: hypothetical protein K5787_12305 [Lentisphaeria bacterium]|nr:hypothetical protein [Lentisphaeria bacterium]